MPPSIRWRPAPTNHLTSGQGKYKFKVAYKGSHLPSAAQEVLEKAHGGFAVDRRDGRGETYFALPGAGIIQISGDLGSTRMLSTDDAMKPHNMHNATIWYDANGGAHLSFPGNGSAAVYTTDLGGKLQPHTLAAGRHEGSGNPYRHRLFQGSREFRPHRCRPGSEASCTLLPATRRWITCSRRRSRALLR